MSVNIENSIKQTRSFDSEQQRAMVNIIYTHNWLKGKMKPFFDGYDITGKQYNILRILKGARKPVSVSFIRERLLDKDSDVSRIVNRMETKGLIIKKNCAKDKRLVDLELSPDGNKLLDTVSVKLQGSDKLLESLDEAEIIKLNALLDKLRSE